MGVARIFGGLMASTVMVATTVPATAQNKTAEFQIPAGTLKAAIKAWSRTSGLDIIYREDDLAKARSKGVSGRMDPIDALGMILADSGFTTTFTDNGVAIVRQVPEGNATPEILVIGKGGGWSLNTGIARSRDDSQPFIVMTQEDIKRSGAPDLDTFLRNQLQVNAAPITAEQAGQRQPGMRGIGQVNLRGLGARETLILVDGRRQPGVNLGNGQINQAQITGIPLAAIERIEVLASSASGIYGSGATGGVINIILRRGYRGGELALSYADTSDFAQGDGRVDLTTGTTLEGGRTNVSVTASWRKQRPLLYGDRVDLFTRNRAAILANDPGAFDALTPPTAATPNFQTLDGAPLVLKPQYGGTTLTSAIGHVPDGYRGLATDGVAPLLAGIGRYNFTQADSATGGGARAPLLFGSENAAGSLAVRREFNDWLTAYVEGSASRYWSRTMVTRSPSMATLADDAPNNPFTQSINISLPQGNAEASVASRNDQLRGVVGAIVKLPYKWQALADLSWSRSRFVSDRSPPNTTAAFNASLDDGTRDVLRDLRLAPLDYRYIDSGFGSLTTPGVSRITTGSLRLAGPLPLSLPGGKTNMTVNMERSNEISDPTYFATNGGLSFVTYSPRRAQMIESVYGEVAFPLFGEQNHVPFARMLELRVSARHERYRGIGALATVQCQFTFGPLASDDITAGCPPTGANLGMATTRNSHTDPSISFRWAPISDITFRGSYTTGYLPPQLDQLTRREGVLYVERRDPERGGELIGIASPGGNTLPGFFGGNPAVRPESSTTLTAGAIVTPRFLTGLRLSADWTRIRKKDNYFNPLSLAYNADDPAAQRAFEIFLKQNPGRITRGPASGGFAVGPITSIDLSMVNLVGSEAEAVDFALDYSDKLLGGTIDLSGTATWVRRLQLETFPGEPATDYTGVSSTDFASGAAANGSLRWRGIGSVRWTKGALSLSWQGRYFDSYYLELDRSVVAGLGSARVASQFYQDIGASYTFDHGVTLRAGVNNVFGRRPPLDTQAAPVYYSRYGDPRLTNGYLTVTKAF